jgi:hypothetical protein
MPLVLQIPAISPKNTKLQPFKDGLAQDSLNWKEPEKKKKKGSLLLCNILQFIDYLIFVVSFGSQHSPRHGQA